jgi:tRNA(Arg) A34 adenosine deaminase TadA
MRTPQINERMNDRDLMRKAIELSIENIKNGGGSFGAVIAKDGEIIATGTNRVTADNDPTAHAEVNAIRKACQTLKTFDLSGCTIYTSCEPCPMCLAAIYWAHIDKIYYGNNKKDAADIGFDDSYIYDELNLPVEKRTKLMNELLPGEAIKAFQLWANTEEKTEY